MISFAGGLPASSGWVLANFEESRPSPAPIPILVVDEHLSSNFPEYELRIRVRPM
jgi:hypothetical protein